MPIKKIGIISAVLFFAIIGFSSAEEQEYIPLAADQAIEASQGQIIVSGIKYPDGALGSSFGQGILVTEDGLIESALHIFSPPEFEEEDNDILTKQRTVMFRGVHADIVYASSFYDTAIYKLRRIPIGMKPAVFSKKHDLFQPVFARIKAFIHSNFKGEVYGYFLDLPYKGILVNSAAVYKNINKAPELTGLELLFLDHTAKSGFSGAMFVNSQGEVVGMGDAIDGGYTITISSAVTLKKALEEYKSGTSGSGKKEKTGNEQENSENASAALSPDLLKAFEKADIFKEILGYYDARALDRPKDLVKCAEEMLAIQPSGECRDRFTHYLNPEQARKRREESSLKEYSGIGIQLKEMEGKVFIIDVTPGLPAEKAGIKAGDVIIEINGVAIISSAQAAALIRENGAGAEIKVIVDRKGTGELLAFFIRTEKIEVSAVSYKSIEAGSKPTVGYIKVADFSHEEVFNDFKKALVQFKKQDIGNIIIDLRGNGGGRIDLTFQMLSLFMKADDIAITMRTRFSSIPVDMRELRDYFEVSEFGTFKNMKAVVLINEQSASASEIFAGAMKDWGAAKIIGRVSFGKGVGQTCFDLSDKSLFCLTTFEFTVGNHNVVIRDKGVIPDIEVRQGEDSLQKALEILWNQ